MKPNDVLTWNKKTNTVLFNYLGYERIGDEVSVCNADNVGTDIPYPHCERKAPSNIYFYLLFVESIGKLTSTH